MITPTAVAARATAVLTGSGTTDYAADLDMLNTLDGFVTVSITGTLGSLTNIIPAFHAGAAANPTDVMGNGVVAMQETITDATWTRVVTLRVCARYFRASVTGTGATPTSSDAVINYYYQPKANAMTIASSDGILKISS